MAAETSTQTTDTSSEGGTGSVALKAKEQQTPKYKYLLYH